MLEQTHDYNDLIPPENPDYPWNPKHWQLLCYYCNQPIRVVQSSAGYRQRGGFTWEHVSPIFITDIDVAKHPEIPNLKAYQQYTNSHYHCNPLFVRPTEEIDDPRCHICGTQTTKHGDFCSAGGQPGFRATTMSQKENELIRRFGWTRESETVKKERERVSATEAVGALTIVGVLLGLLAWITGPLPHRKMDVKS